MLEHLGHSVVVVPDGAKALAALEDGRFDVVLMDLQMPEMDGFEALREIRRRDLQRGECTPVIALTAHAMQGDRERCLSAGFDGYLAKPIRQADLQSGLERLERPQVPHSADPSRSLIEALTEICGGDEDFARDLAITFLESVPGCLAGIDLALRTGDSAGLSGHAHALKGISRTIGAENLALACVDIEQASKRDDLERAAREVCASGRCLGGREERSGRVSGCREQDMKLLIAEDQAPSAFYLRHTLEKMGHEITVAPDGEQAWRILQSENPPLLISDWMMPLLDGPALCRRIRSTSADRYTYIILLTSRDRKEDRLEGLRRRRRLPDQTA